KTPAATATAANVTTARLVMVEPPYGRSRLSSISALYHRVPQLRRVSRRKVPRGCRRCSRNDAASLPRPRPEGPASTPTPITVAPPAGARASSTPRVAPHPGTQVPAGPHVAAGTV